MNNNKDIITELSDIAPALLQVDSVSLYQVPDQYFEQLADSIAHKIVSGEMCNYAFTHKNPYTVPHNYFTDLPEVILQKIYNTNSTLTVFDEMENISPLLNTINKKNVYSIPENYFSVTEQRFVLKADAIPTNTKTRVFTMYKLAVAAVITAIICIGIFLLSDKTSLNDNNVVKTELNTLSEDDIATFLTQEENSDNASAPKITSSAVTVDINKAIKDLPDEEINQFLHDIDITEGI